MNPLSADVLKSLSGIAHADAEPSAKQAALRYATGLRTQYHHREEGSPEMRNAQLFLFRSAFPARYAASLMTLAQRLELEGRTEAEIIELYHTTLREEKERELIDTTTDLCRTTSWLQKAADTERDLAHDARKAAIERWFAENHVPASRVWK